MVLKRKLIKDENSEMELKRVKLIADMIYEDCVRGDVERLQNILPKVSLDSEVIQQIDNNRSLHEMIKTGCVSTVKQMLAFKVEFDCLNSEGLSPLHLACQNRYTEVVEELLRNGANPNLKCSINDKSPLHYVVESIYMKEEEGQEIIEKIISIIKFLLNNGADINAVSANGTSVLNSAIVRDGLNVVKVLLRNGANVNTKRSPLHTAAEYNLIEILEVLLDYKADINAGDVWEKTTPLQIAAQEGHLATVRKLLQRGADVDAIFGDNKHHSALYLACQEGHLEIVKELLRFGAKIDFPGTKASPLHEATIGNNLEIVKELLKHGALVDAIDEERSTALHFAAMTSNVKIVQQLLKNGANVNAKMIDGDSVLHVAIRVDFYSHYEESLATLKVLLEDKNIDLNIQDDFEITPLEKAIDLKYSEITKMIAKKMCPKPKINDSIYPLKHFM